MGENLSFSMVRNSGVAVLALTLSSLDSHPQKALTLGGDIWETEKGELG